MFSSYDDRHTSAKEYCEDAVKVVSLAGITHGLET